MRKSDMYALLGLKLEACIHRNHFPMLDADIFSAKDFSKLRNQLYKAPASDQKLAKQMIPILLKGKIEEIKAIDKLLILSVQFEYKGELYLADLKLEHYIWSFVAIQYAGEAPRAKKIGIKVGLAILGLAILLVAALFIIEHAKEPETMALEDLTDVPSSNQNIELESAIDSEDSIPLSELEQMAKKMDLVLIDEDEYQSLLQERSEAETSLRGEEANQSVNETNETVSSTTSTSKTEAAAKSMTISVTYKMTAQQVAQLIVDSNLDNVKDVDELTNYFIEQDIHYRIRTGLHEIPVDATYEDIVRIITSRK